MADNALSVYEFLPPGPSRRALTVTPSDDNDLAFIGRYLWVGTAGDVKVVMANGETVKFVNVPAGCRLEISVKRVLAAETTAGSIVALE